jgi:hypothetical protein
MAALPERVRRDAEKAWRMWQTDRSAPGLQFKKLNVPGSYWSARVNDDYRVVGLVRADAVIWFWIGSHSEYEKLLKGI